MRAKSIAKLVGAPTAATNAMFRSMAGNTRLYIDERCTKLIEDLEETRWKENGIELDDPGRGVAAKQGALRPTQHFNPVQIEHREALQDRVFQYHIVIDQADRLRGVEIEIGVAKAADVKARESTAE